MHINLYEFDSIDSTNNYLIRELKSGTHDSQSLTICTAKEQTKAHGQFNRAWHSPGWKNVYLSVLYTIASFRRVVYTRSIIEKQLARVIRSRLKKIDLIRIIPFNKKIKAGMCLPIGYNHDVYINLNKFCVMTIIKTLNNFGIQNNLVIKYPNDILYNNKKLSGILVEIFNCHNTNAYNIIIGIGLNVNMITVPNNLINQPWTSMQLITNQPQDLDRVQATLINNLIIAIK